jgi:hypothetical protein
VVGALIGNFARRVDILDLGNRQDGRLALRLALPNDTGGEKCRDDQSETG